MERGKYIVLEGIQGVGKSTIAGLLARKLKRRGQAVRIMHEPDGQADPTTQEIRRLTQDPNYPMNTRTEVLLYNAARCQSLETVRTARNNGEVVIVDRSYLTTLAVQFYGRGDVPDYQRLNDIISFAVGDMWPDLTIVIDAPVQTIQQRIQSRGETERFDTLSPETLERIRAGYLWEAKQRNMPVVYATDSVDEVFQDVWKHVATFLSLDETAEEEPTPIADLLATSPAAKILQEKTAASASEPDIPYYTPESLPDDVQCDYCDDIEHLLRARRQLAAKLAKHLQAETPDLHSKSLAHEAALKILRPLLPVASSDEQSRALLAQGERLELDTDTLQQLPNGFASTTEPVKLVRFAPRNELDLLPAMLYESVDLPLSEVKAVVETWPYEIKSRLFLDYVQRYPRGRALAGAQYEWDFLDSFAQVLDLPKNLHANIRLQTLTPRYGYSTPPEVEAAGLSDEYDAIFDQSLTFHSTLQARGFAAESQYVTLLGHKQRWSVSISFREISALIDATSQTDPLNTALANVHPLLSENRHSN
ncbi:dTMP kinase [Candidatus Saccharibacteria bacterium]|nr:MAG: dTMP kinase [Candidatus Saccharibacteria bacterium]